MLTNEEWESIYEAIRRSIPGKEIATGTVVKRDADNKLIWTSEFGDTAIPLCSFDYTFSYYDTQPTGANVTAGVPLPTKLVKKVDATQKDPTLIAKIIVPRIGDTVVILKPWGTQRFPICIGKMISTNYWTGEE